MEQQKWSKGMVAYHWLAAIAIFGLLITGISHMTWLDPHTVMDHVNAMLANSGEKVSRKVMFAFFNATSGSMMQIHFYLGFALAVLILVRIGLYAKGERRVTKLFRALFVPDTSKKKPLRNVTYAIAYLGILTMVITGLLMYFDRDLGIGRGTHEVLMDIHQTTMFILLTYVIIHIIGVFWAENTDEPGIVSTMINGKAEEAE
ncbi:MAG TPA: cytochrome b/b6 domain-containing protein [Balneolales bacterium]|nr:cytochrome b/b6 domain-containing protein [Balneolales bacterium]